MDSSLKNFQISIIYDKETYDARISSNFNNMQL